MHMKKNQYKDGKEHGYWEYYYANGNIMFKGYYKNGKDHGFWEEYGYTYGKRVIKQFHL